MSATIKPNGSQEAATSLLDLANALHTSHVKPASDGYVAALKALRGVDYTHAQPLDNALRYTAELFLATEQLEDATSHAMKALREKIAATMADTGSIGFYTAGHHVTATEPPRTAVITDPVALAASHPDLMTDPKPAPDRVLVAKVLRDGFPVAGATLSNGGAAGVRFSPIKKSK